MGRRKLLAMGLSPSGCSSSWRLIGQCGGGQGRRVSAAAGYHRRSGRRSQEPSPSSPQRQDRQAVPRRRQGYAELLASLGNHRLSRCLPPPVSTSCTICVLGCPLPPPFVFVGVTGTEQSMCRTRLTLLLLFSSPLARLFFPPPILAYSVHAVLFIVYTLPYRNPYHTGAPGTAQRPACLDLPPRPFDPLP
ncbi:hypothetical protein F5Y10DRAFT_244315 [Nemania abortiva]|nr:hypothetical protein F5Y10DRAFT_244315 [Nemania abortiva]